MENPNNLSIITWTWLPASVRNHLSALFGWGHCPSSLNRPQTIPHLHLTNQQGSTLWQVDTWGMVLFWKNSNLQICKAMSLYHSSKLMQASFQYWGLFIDLVWFNRSQLKESNPPKRHLSRIWPVPPDVGKHSDHSMAIWWGWKIFKTASQSYIPDEVSGWHLHILFTGRIMFNPPTSYSHPKK